MDNARFPRVILCALIFNSRNTKNYFHENSLKLFLNSKRESTLDANNKILKKGITFKCIETITNTLTHKLSQCLE